MPLLFVTPAGLPARRARLRGARCATRATAADPAAAAARVGGGEPPREYVVETIRSNPIGGMRAGTSGLRKLCRVFAQPHYLQNVVHSMLTAVGEVEGKEIVVGGDGRFWTPEAIAIILRVAAGMGVREVLVAKDGLMCTPAVSAAIRARGLLAGLILTASHNPGGMYGDFGVKLNVANGGPAPDAVMDRAYAESLALSGYRYAVGPGPQRQPGRMRPGWGVDPFEALDLSVLGAHAYVNARDGGDFTIRIIDGAAEYVALLRSMFDFDALRALLARDGFSMLFDAMSGASGPYARAIFVDALGAPEDALMRADPLPDFGGAHPDPNLTYAAELVARCDPAQNDAAPALGAASDGDGDRNMILGAGVFVAPSDSLAIIAARGEDAIPWFRASGITGVARSMPTAGAVDAVAAARGWELHETPTGWKHFGALLAAGRAQLCGEESFGTGSHHVLEKDGLFAVLCWLSILAHASEQAGALASVRDVVSAHWAEFGRHFAARHDYEGLPADAADALVAHLRALQEGMASALASGATDVPLADGHAPRVVSADDFAYTDPVGGEVSERQGLRFVLSGGRRVVFRLSGTGSSGATLRVYAERFEPDVALHGLDAQDALAEVFAAARAACRLEEFTGREAPTVMT